MSPAYMADEGDSDEEAPDGDSSGSCILVKQLVLGLVELGMSLFLFPPELIVGCVRLCLGIWSQVTGQQNWTPQDLVEKEIEEDLSMAYAFKKCWIVCVAGLAYFLYAMIAGLAY